MDYIAFIAGLPEMARGEWKPPLSVFDFREQLKDYVREKDRQLLDLFFLPRDHVQVLRLLRKEKPDVLQTVFPLQVLEEEVIAPDDRIPAYLRHFITDFKEGHLEAGLLPENVLSWRYYDYLQQSGNRLVREYAAYSLNLKNLEVALNARKHGREIAREIVGANAFADALRASGSRDFGLSADYPYVEQVIAIMELEDLVERERRLDLMLWDCEMDRVVMPAVLSGLEWMETFPTWSPDGKTLYFCRSKAVTKQTPLDSIYYDLYKCSFDVSRCSFGKPECVYEVSSKHKSISFPRVSPDGNYLMFTLSGYGNFSIWHPESDLYLLDLRNGEVRCLKEVNSERVESFHNWSSSGKWFVFSSKRIDGLWAHPYIASFDPSTGVAGKPFPVPQEEPDFYLTFMQSFNLPEFLIRPVTENQESFEQIQNKCLSSSPNQL